jgi:D-glycero-alpha-D-manno-heptose-7-phosphate kinase
MIITRSPLRITLGGGGTDLPSYYVKNGGYLITAAINKYVYVTLNRPFNQGIYLKYSNIEKESSIENLKHPIIREALKILQLRTPQIEITTLADIPSGTGLGSSGSFTTALLKGLFTYYRKSIDPKELAELACDIEINKLKEPIGIQDQYIAVLGGLQELDVSKTGRVKSSPLPVSISTLHDLEDNLLLFYTGLTRAAGTILGDQDFKSQKNDSFMLDNLHLTKELGYQSREALVSGDVKKFAHILNTHWENKQKRTIGISNSFISEIYSVAMQNGALGGKLVGAGGGGFLLFYATDKERLRKKMKDFNLEEVRFNFDFEGTKVILS